MNDIWHELQRDPPKSVVIAGTTVRRGTRVRLNPRARGDVFDDILAGKVGFVEGLDENLEGEIQIAVTLEDDPGRDLGDGRYPGHRFFFSTEEVEPVANNGDELATARAPRLLIAGIGNIFLGDDGFGVAVAQRLAERTLPPGVDVRDFGIRGMDLAYALQNDYDAVIFIDATPRGEAPGTLYVIDARVDADGPMTMDTHGMDPVKVLALARAIGRVPPRVIVLGCEPVPREPLSSLSELDMSLSAPMLAAIGEAIAQAEALALGLLDELTSPQLPSEKSLP